MAAELASGFVGFIFGLIAGTVIMFMFMGGHD